MVVRIPLAHQESLAFQLGGQPADAAFLKPQPLGQVALGQRRAGVQFMQRERLRQGDRVPGDGLVRLQQAGGPDDVHQQFVEALCFRGVHLMRSHTHHRPGTNSCALQLADVQSTIVVTHN
jgi:hypothetical protein